MSPSDSHDLLNMIGTDRDDGDDGDDEDDEDKQENVDASADWTCAKYTKFWFVILFSLNLTERKNYNIVY